MIARQEAGIRFQDIDPLAHKALERRGLRSLNTDQTTSLVVQIISRLGTKPLPQGRLERLAEIFNALALFRLDESQKEKIAAAHINIKEGIQSQVGDMQYFMFEDAVLIVRGRKKYMMATEHIINGSLEDEIVRLRNAGETNTQISEKLGITIKTTKRITRQLTGEGLVEKRRPGPRTERSYDGVIVHLRNQGLTNKKISEMLDLHVGTVNNHVSRLCKEGRLSRRQDPPGNRIEV